MTVDELVEYVQTRLDDGATDKQIDAELAGEDPRVILEAWARFVRSVMDKTSAGRPLTSEEIWG